MGSEPQSSKITLSSARVLTNVRNFWTALPQQCSPRFQHAQCTRGEEPRHPSGPALTQDLWVTEAHKACPGLRPRSENWKRSINPENSPPLLQSCAKSPAAYCRKQAKKRVARERFQTSHPHPIAASRGDQQRLLETKSEAGILRTFQSFRLAQGSSGPLLNSQLGWLQHSH